MNGPDDETRATLLDAARSLLAADGPAALTVRRIAAEAGMSTMNV
jgi:AcrR family transcriptional regulator